MQLNTLLQQATKKLEKISDSANLDAELLLCHITGFAQHQLITHSESTISQQQLDNFNQLLERRLQHEPIAYIINNKEFYGYDFYVDNRVLIPRPETEELVDYALKHANKPGSILDVACGSGCIGLSLLLEYIKQNHPVKVTALDVSKSALQVTTINIERLLPKQFQQQIETVESDILQANLKQKYDLIVSNPPYIPSARIQNLEASVSNYEPILALDGGELGSKFFFKLLKLYQENLTSGGMMIVETDHTHLELLKQLIAANLPQLSNDKIEFIKDYAGKDRFLVLYS